MCKKLKGIHNGIDKCMRIFIIILGASLKENHKIVACCCGHGKYPMTIIVKVKWETLGDKVYDLVSGKEILRKRNFYKQDKQGYYFIPEVMEK